MRNQIKEGLGASMPLMQRIMKFVASSGILPDASLLELYPPFMPMRIKVLEIADHWRTVRILLPLNARSRNPVRARVPEDRHEVRPEAA